MKILEITPNLHCGGAEKLVVDLTNELSARGNECTIVTLFDLDTLDIFKSLINDGIKFHSLGKRLGFDLKCLYHLYKFINEEKPDIVHAHTGGITYLILAVLLHRNAKYFATIHSDAKAEAGRGLHKIIRKFLFKLKIVTPITISEDSELSFKKYYGRAGHLITNGCSKYSKAEIIDQEKNRKDVDFLFVHVGSIQPVKNQLTLVKVFRRLLEEGKRVRLLFMGRIADQNIYNSLEPYFSENIVYIGEQQNPRDYMNICDAYCMTSLWEGMPISIIEAFSVGCIPITTPVGGCINMINNGNNGILAKDTSEEAVYQAIKQYINLDKSTRIAMSKNALRSYQELYSIEKTALEYLRLFEQKNG